MSLRTLAHLSALCIASIASAALAQTPPSTETPPPATTTTTAAPAADTPKPSLQEEVLVTGSRVRRKDLTTPAPVTVLSREQFEASGKTTIGQFLQLMPEQGNAPNFQLNNGGATYSADGATRVNLRALGVTRTLVLINGRRMVPSGVGASSSVDLNTIPTEAVERVEVLKDGGSAIYGSDAIAGVVNIITRHTYNGTEASAEYGLSQHGDAQTLDAHVMTGRSGEYGNFMFSVGYFNQKASFLGDRDWSAHALDYDYTTGKTPSAGSGRVPQGNVGLPANSNGTPTAGCLANQLCKYLVTTLDPAGWTNDTFIHDPTALNGWRVFQNADRYNFATVNYLTIPSTRISAWASGDTRWNFVRGYFESSYVQHDSAQNAAPMPLNPGDYNLVVSKDSMYNPFGVDLPFAGRRLVEFGNRGYSQDLATFHVVTGLDGTLPESLRSWYWNASLNYGRTTGTFVTHGALRNSRVNDVVGPSKVINGVPTCLKDITDNNSAISGCTPINLFGGPGTIDPAQIGYLGFTGTSQAFDQLTSVNFDLSGDLFRIAAERPASLAIGYEFRRQVGAQTADPIAEAGDSADFNFKSTSGAYNANEIYGELSLPFISGMNGVEALEANAAIRYVNYSTFGGNTSYKVGARYTPIRDVTLRGTYSTAFRAPSISELYLGATETAPTATDPCNSFAGDPTLQAQCVATGVGTGGSGDNGLQELARQGGNAKLQPETAKIFTAGFVLEPTMLRGLSVTFDYYHTDVDNVIGTIGVSAILAGCYPGAGGTSYQPYCDLIHRSSFGRILYIDDVNQNVGQLSTAGIDFAARYAFGSDVGRFTFLFTGNWLQYYDRTTTLATGTSTTHAKGTYDLAIPLPALKFNTGVNWNIAGLGAGVLVRYVGNFRECANPSDPTTAAGGLCGDSYAYARQIGHNVVVDLNASYALASAAGTTTFGFGIANVLDQAPQYIYSAALANSDPSLYDYLGRYVYGRVAHKF